MTDKNRKGGAAVRQRGEFKISIGTSSVLMIFVVLCLTTFAVLSFVTANADARLPEKAVQGVDAYYAADAKAQEALASLDARLADCALDAEALAEAEDASISLTEDQKQEIADIRADASLPSDQKRAAIYRLLVGSVTLTEVDLSLAEGGETEAALAYFSLPAGEDRLLEVSLSLSGDPEASERYRVTRYQLVSTKEWEEEDPGLWTGPEGQIGEVIE